MPYTHKSNRPSKFLASLVAAFIVIGLFSLFLFTSAPSPTSAAISSDVTGKLAHFEHTATLSANNQVLGASPLPAVASEVIAFVSDRDGNSEIYFMNPDGTGQIRVTNNPANDTEPAISPDGTKIAFTSDRDTHPQIYVINLDGSGLTRLTNSAAADHSPAWSRDGTRIAFISDRDVPAPHAEIYVMNTDGSNQTRLTYNNTYIAHPSFCGTTKITFDTFLDGWDIYTINTDGTNQTRLTTAGAVDDNPSCSPDGSKIVFTTTRDSGSSFYEIYSMNVDGTNQTRLTFNDPIQDLLPTFSPDGNRIAFQTDRDGNWEIYLMNTDGTNQTRLTNNAASDVSPSWAASGVSPTPTPTPSPTCELVANAGPDRTVRSGQLVRFDASESTCASSVTRYRWDFGDNQTAEGLRVVHAFSVPRMYEVRLSIEDANGRSASDTVAVTITALTTTASFSKTDSHLILHSASVTATYYWAGDFANGAVYQVTNLTYFSTNVVYSDIFIVSSVNGIVPLPQIGCFVNPGSVIYFKSSVVGTNRSWNVDVLVSGTNALVLRGLSAKGCISATGPCVSLEYNCAYNFFSP